MNYVAACDAVLLTWHKKFRKIRHEGARKTAIARLGAEAERMRNFDTREKPKPVKARVGNREIIPIEPDVPVNFSGVVEGTGLPKPTGYPDETELTLIGVCPNPRLLKAELPDGRVVSVWKGPRQWRLPCKIQARKDPMAAGVYFPV